MNTKMLIFRNKTINQFFILCLLCIFSLLFCWSCTRVINAKIDEIGSLPIPQIEPLPLTAGVYYGNDFRTYKTSQTYNDPDFIFNVQL